MTAPSPSVTFGRRFLITVAWAGGMGAVAG